MPSMGAIVTLALSRRTSMGEPRRGTSSANGCGSGWQPTISRTAAAAVPRLRRGVVPIIRAAAHSRPAEEAKTMMDEALTPELTNLRRAASLLLEHDCGEPAPIGVLATQAAAPIAEEPLFLGNGVIMGLLHRPDSRLSEPMLDIARQIEHEMAGAHGWREVRFAGGILREKSLWKFPPDLVRAASDARPDRRADPAALCADHLHLLDRGLDHAAESAAPTAMRRPDDVGNGILEQDRGTIGGKHAKRDVGNPSDHAISPRCGLRGPGPLYDDNGGAVDLTASHQPISREVKLPHCDPTVPRNAFRCVARAKPAIQRFVQSAADSAPARKEGMSDTGIVIEKAKSDHHSAAE